MHRAIRVGRSFNCFFLTMALVGSYLLFLETSQENPAESGFNRQSGFGCQPGKRPAFVELIYEHNFAPVTGGDIPSPASAKSLNGFFLDAKGTTLYS